MLSELAKMDRSLRHGLFRVVKTHRDLWPGKSLSDEKILQQWEKLNTVADCDLCIRSLRKKYRLEAIDKGNHFSKLRKCLPQFDSYIKEIQELSQLPSSEEKEKQIMLQQAIQMRKEAKKQLKNADAFKTVPHLTDFSPEDDVSGCVLQYLSPDEQEGLLGAFCLLIPDSIRTLEDLDAYITESKKTQHIIGLGIPSGICICECEGFNLFTPSIRLNEQSLIVDVMMRAPSGLLVWGNIPEETLIKADPLKALLNKHFPRLTVTLAPVSVSFEDE
jgi:hypothetical protein